MGAIGKLDDAIQASLVQAFDNGATCEIACGLVGIATETLYAWQRRGKAEKTEGKDTKYTRFTDAIKKARSKIDQRLIDNIQQAAFERDQWQAACWLLERKDGAKWGKNATPRYTLTGDTPEEKIECIYDLMASAKMTTQAGTALIASLQKQQELSQAAEFREEIARLQAIIDQKLENGSSSNEEISYEKKLD